MKVEIGALCLAFLGGMVVQDQMTPDEVVWKDYGEDPMSNAKFLADMQAAAMVGEQHELLAASAGEYTVDGKWWMKPGEEPFASPATATRRTILGGRFLVEEYHADFMGMPFEGMMIQGYDNLAGESFTIWMDSMSTWPSISRGGPMKDGVLELTGVMKDVMTPGGRPVRSVTKKTGDGVVMSMYDSAPGGGEFQVMEMTYKKKGEGK